MFSKLSSYNPIRKTFLTLEHTEQEGKLLVLGLEIQLRKDELDITQSFTSEKLENIVDFAKTNTNTTLVITDENVLTKEVHHIGTDNEILSEGFPNLNLDDFYYQILKTATKSFIAVCRKQYVDDILNDYKSKQINISEVSLGNLKMAALLPYIHDQDIISNTSIIRVENGNILTIDQKDAHITTTYDIENFSVDNTHSLPLAIVLHSFASQVKITGNIEERNIQLQSALKEASFFKKTLQYGIGFLLITLLINFFVFNAKYKKWQGLQEEIHVYTTQNENIQEQQVIISAKEAIVNSILTTGFSKSSLYIDQIIQSQPTTVILDALVYQPISKTIRNDKPILLKENLISVAGNSIDKADFTAWLNTIEKLDFVDAVTIINYGVDKKNTSNFEITINLSHDTAK
ncbi:hypothetical protein [Aquimarina sp. AU474]|uniref:hypothetical protein n=1 Tax=Aquimarina sp. AU474 TaxID=2108529 RepID=UPI000D69B9CC|nr:hypothetical protein [Aquimarina sp. AU474]